MENNLLDVLKAITLFNEQRISKQIEDIVSKNLLKNDAYQSENISELAAAFAKAQGEFPSVGFNRDNTFFKSSYADLDAILRTVKPPLSKNGLSFFQFTNLGSNGEIVLHSRLMHSSGQWMETRSRIIPEKGDHQSYGKAVSYHRRYGAMTLLGITASNDPSDDDAEGLMDRARDMSASSTIHKYKPDQQSATPITKEQLEQLEFELNGYPELAEKFMVAHKIEELCDLPKSMFLDSINKIRSHKSILNKAK